jgi:2-keto-4-pentenoate hydratase/2-oxohepta-3-ene-1,7-dioic acid hydratase in catechol pathway
MRIANYEGRLVVVAGVEGHEIAHDVEKNSGGRFGPEPQAIYEDWDAFTGWAAGARWEGGAPVRPDGLGSPAPAPRQVFGIGLNYRDHAAESGLPVPAGEPPVFTKFPSCITGPHGDTSCRRAVTSTGRPSWWPSSAAEPAMSRPNGGWNTWPVTPSARTYPNGSCS